MFIFFEYYWTYICSAQIEPLKFLIGEFLFGKLGVQYSERQQSRAQQSTAQYSTIQHNTVQYSMLCI